MALMDRLLRLGEGKLLKQLSNIAKQVNAIEEDFVAMSDEELRGQTGEFRARYEKGETLESLLPEAFATVREASRRVLDKRHFDVQVMGGAALHMGNIAEMKTGEGKTLVATMPSYLNALTGRGVHIVTVNDYLAKRDSEWMGRIHHFLGVEVGAILSQMDPAERRKAYQADITYGTNNEFGFDYLRDNMALSLEDCVQRGHHYAIVDEVDSILIDEARTPLIISGPAEDTGKWYPEFAKLVNRLRRDEHYEVDEKKRTVAINETGIDAVEDWLGIHNLYESANTPLISYLNNAIKAKELFKLDRDYVVIDGEVLIVDEHTGRTLIGRRYNEGLHQAIEAKGERPDPRRIPDTRHDQPAELLPDVRQARRDDGHSTDRGQRVSEDLRPRRRADSDQHADDPRGPARSDLPHRRGEVRSHRQRCRGAAREGPAGAHRHRLRRQIRNPVRAAEARRGQA